MQATTSHLGSVRLNGARLLAARLALAGLVLLAAALLGACRRDHSSASVTAAPAAAEIIENKGSDTLVNLALAWAERYMQEHPEVRISVTGGGSGTGIAALINGTVDIANASRALKEEEISAAQNAGFEAKQVAVAMDAIAVVVHPSNPIDELTIPQLADIFTGRITNWREVGGPDRPIVLLSRESNSGTYVYFLEHVIRQGQADNRDLFSPGALLMPSSEGISNEVRQNPNAIGYDGLGYVTADQKTLRIAPRAGAVAVAPTVETVVQGTYPIARPMFFYTPPNPPEHVAKYIAWVLAPEGQALIKEKGYIPLEAK